MKTIPLKNSSLLALVDDADFDLLSCHIWLAHESKPGKFYAKTYIDGQAVYMHKMYKETSRIQRKE